MPVLHSGSCARRTSRETCSPRRTPGDTCPVAATTPWPTAEQRRGCCTQGCTCIRWGRGERSGCVTRLWHRSRRGCTGATTWPLGSSDVILPASRLPWFTGVEDRLGRCSLPLTLSVKGRASKARNGSGSVLTLAMSLSSTYQLHNRWSTRATGPGRT